MEAFIYNILNISMEEAFLKLLNMTITASWLILAVVILRVLLKKAPKAFRCFLWALVAVRLICPFSLESVFSLIPSGETVPQDILYMEEPAIQSGVPVLNNAVNPVLSESLSPTVGDSANPLQVVVFVAAILWMVGLIAMLLYAVVSYFRIHRKVAASMLLKDNIYLCDYIDTPFILGAVKPRIYIPSTLEEDKMAYVIAHEQAHLQRCDHWWKPLGFGLLAVYWFNPLIWLAYILLCRDIELACDERVIRRLGEADKKSYSEALLFCSVPRKMTVACPLAFGEVCVKERVRMVLNYKKPAFWVIIVAVLTCIIVTVCFLTNPKESMEASQEPFGSTFYVKGLLYDAPEYSSTYPVDDRSIYSFTSDSIMMTEGNIGLGRVYEEWVALGGMREVDLTEDNFDDYFREVDGVSGWLTNQNARSIRRNNKKAWELIVDGGAGKVSVSYYILQQKNGDVYLACWYYDEERETDVMSDASAVRWLLELERADYITRTVETPVDSVQSVLAGNYVTSACLYMNPLSSSIGGSDSGKIYQFAENAFIIQDKFTGNQQSIEPQEWEWQEFPYTDEEWNALYVPGGFGAAANISEQYDEMRYLHLSSKYRLLKLDDSLWLVQMNENPQMGEYIWSIYSLVSESSVDASQEEQLSILSLHYPYLR